MIRSKNVNRDKPVFPTPVAPSSSIRNGLGFVCRPIFANDDFGDVEFILFFSLVQRVFTFSGSTQLTNAIDCDEQNKNSHQ